LLINIPQNRREEFLLELIQAGCSLTRACGMLGLTIHQGRYALEKRGTSVRKLKQYRRIKKVSQETVDMAHRLLAAGATGLEIAMLTGLSVDQICYLDTYGYWVEGVKDVFA